MTIPADKVPVLLAAGGEAWEATALRALAADGLVVLKRCVDLADLLASAATGQAGVAVVSADLAGLDADAVMQLLRHDVRCVAVGGDARLLDRIGVVSSLAAGDLAALPDAARSAASRELVIDPDPLPEPTADGRDPRRQGGGGPRTRRAHRAGPRSPSASRPSTPGVASPASWSTPTRTAAWWPSTSACSTR